MAAMALLGARAVNRNDVRLILLESVVFLDDFVGFWI
jgi:hypothetical protein